VGGGQGWFFITELAYAPAAGPTRLKLGLWHHTATFGDDISARFGGAPSDRNALAWAFDAGLAWTGCIPGRPADIATLGFARATFGSRYAENARLIHPSASRISTEQVVELSYTAPLGDRFSLKSGLQSIRHPGGSSALPAAVLVMLRFNAGF